VSLAREAGCGGVFIGSSPRPPRVCASWGRNSNLQKGRDFRASVRRIQRHNILVMGSFIIGLDVDEAGIGERVAEAAREYGVEQPQCPVPHAPFPAPACGTR